MEDKIKIELGKIMEDFLYQYLDDSLKTNHTASGNLATSGKYTIDVKGKVYHISFSFADYFNWAEYGRKPGKMPPVEKILEWVKIKPVLPRPMKNGKLPTEKQLSFLIARKIGLQGTKGIHVYEKTLNSFQLTQKLYDAIADRYVELVNNMKFFT